MLVLSRKEGEKILFPELDIVFRVLKVRGKAVSVGIEAPRGIRIVRSELEFNPFPRESPVNRRAFVGITL